MLPDNLRHTLLGQRSPTPIGGLAEQIVIVIFVVAVVLRVVLALRPGLWADEVFSLAMATGHSLEHPAADARADLGDYVEPRTPLPAAEWRRYLDHERPPAGPARVVRAVLLSDSSPPLYYLLLASWTRIAGTSDAALRLFSAAFAVAALPLLWLVGTATVGRRAALFGCFLYAVAPLSVYYASEGRMYALTMFLALLLAWATLRLNGGGGWAPVVVWTGVASAALLTHYFLVFVWIACVVWLLTGRNPGGRRVPIIAAAMSLLVVSPWYARIPESLSRWRVTAGWLDDPPTFARTVKAAPSLAWEMFAPSGLWGGSREVNLAVAAGLGILLVIFMFRGSPRELLQRGPALPLLWLAASIGGLLLFDVLQGTRTTEYVRYAIPGLPAAMLLGGFVASRVPGRASVPLLAAILLVWGIGIAQMLTRPARWLYPYPQIAGRVDQRVRQDDLIIVNSIPSGVLGFARYYEGSAPIASWVEPLGLRDVNSDLPILLPAVRCTIAIVNIHSYGPSSAQRWLELNARQLNVDAVRDSSVEIRYYRPWAAPATCDDPVLARGRDPTPASPS